MRGSGYLNMKSVAIARKHSGRMIDMDLRFWSHGTLCIVLPKSVIKMKEKKRGRSGSECVV